MQAAAFQFMESMRSKYIRLHSVNTKCSLSFYGVTLVNFDSGYYLNGCLYSCTKLAMKTDTPGNV